MNQEFLDALSAAYEQYKKQPLFPGRKVFELKATHGLPLMFTLDRLEQVGANVEWPSFIDAARANGWWDHQTYRVLCEGLEDSGLPKNKQDSIRFAFQIYMVHVPHPGPKGKT